jgi:small subunit ribosomal protein S2
VVAVIDSNSDPKGITHPIPGNDDALRAITLYCDLVSSAVLDGLQAEMVAAGVDVGEAEEVQGEALPAEPAGEGEAQPAQEGEQSQPAA